jgi:hypothetical protein
MPFKQIADKYNKGKNTPIGLIFELGFFTQLTKKAYNPNTREFCWAKIAADMDYVFEDMVSNKKRADAKNMALHAKFHSSSITSDKEFRQIARRYFYVKKVAFVTKVPHSYMLPIYLLKMRRTNLFFEGLLQIRELINKVL